MLLLLRKCSNPKPWCMLTTSIYCLTSVPVQISPLRPQRPKSQVINVMSSERRFSVSPSPPSSQMTPPPITPRTKLSFSLQSSKSGILTELWILYKITSSGEMCFLSTDTHLGLGSLSSPSGCHRGIACENKNLPLEIVLLAFASKTYFSILQKQVKLLHWKVYFPFQVIINNYLSIEELSKISVVLDSVLDIGCSGA